jgi:hypothetical protein
MYLTAYRYGDIVEVQPATEQYLIDAYESDPDIYLRTFRTEDGTPVVIGMCAKTGEIGLIQSGSTPPDAKEFYTLVVVFCAEGFAHSGADQLFTGFDPASASNMRWCKFLRMQRAKEQIDEHLIRGWTTYEFPLKNWVR